jgi:hypothetical protein
MERRQYCVYNQTSECFLSLGVTRDDRGFARIKGILGARMPRYDEGNWISDPKRGYLFRLFSSRDLVFLDEKHRVVRAIESFPRFRLEPVGPEVASVLALPVHTIDSSQTQPGNQLVICVAEEMEFRLRRMPDLEKLDLVDIDADPEALPVRPASSARLVPSTRQDRRNTRRKRWPRLLAFDASGGALEVHGVRDLSASGLYLMTESRWPLGTMLTLTLQRTDGARDDGRQNAITVQLRVIRWGKDGVGLAFTQTETEESPLMVLTAR